MHGSLQPPSASSPDTATLYLEISGMRGFQVEFLPGEIPADIAMIEVRLQDTSNANLGRELLIFRLNQRSDLSWGGHFRRGEIPESWEILAPGENDSIQTNLAKKHQLQGPIDDAFMAPFLFVKPTQDGFHAEVDRWIESELNRGIREWHRQMRGDVIVKTPEQITEQDLMTHHLVLWGDSKSNPLIAKISDRLPLIWTNQELSMAGSKYDATRHVPVMIYPNPLSPNRYVVLNSSFTYREYDYLNNARQVPKLPDWAVIDIATPPDARWPGRVVQADFFDEGWSYR